MTGLIRCSSDGGGVNESSVDAADSGNAKEKGGESGEVDNIFEISSRV